MAETAEPTRASIRPGGRAAKLHNEQVWRGLRELAQVDDDFINEGWSMEALNPGGGKGGNLMAKIGTSFMVKELNAGDHQQLLELADSYSQHVRGGQSLLSPIFMHFQDEETGRNFFAMRNTVGPGKPLELYDLKGCADDKAIVLNGDGVKAVHKRVWNVGMWLSKSSWSEERVRYYNGKLAARDANILVAQGQRKEVLDAMERDVRWLQEHRLMDYSLLVAVKTEADSDASVSKSQLAVRSFPGRRSDGAETTVNVSIIDFFQKWTNGKRVARCVKAAETNKATVPPGFYGERFLRHFASRFTEEASASKAVAPPAGGLVAMAASQKARAASE